MNFKLLLALSPLLATSLAAPTVEAPSVEARGVDDTVVFSVYSKDGCPSGDKSLPLNVKCGQYTDIYGYEKGTRSLKITSYGGEKAHLKAIQACFASGPDGANQHCHTFGNGGLGGCANAAGLNSAWVKFVCIKK